MCISRIFVAYSELMNFGPDSDLSLDNVRTLVDMLRIQGDLNRTLRQRLKRTEREMCATAIRAAERLELTRFACKCLIPLKKVDKPEAIKCAELTAQ